MGGFTANGSSRSWRIGGFKRLETRGPLTVACAMLIACTPLAQNGTDDVRQRRLDMVEQQIRHRGVTDERVLDVMRSVPRERFVPEEAAPHAYEHTPLAIRL